ncbi:MULTISPECIES: hypothetical protein [Acinetobacter]|uniref:hypothetical protein n=1 Tax=Acinetobacter TaxID=469 RepID=UPI0002CF3968|nr:MULTISPECIES: hypothetical protein [Acinetobacter]ENX63617.1 hypothetical protein F885_00361 [Acinetobacter higginsii]MCH7318648.1 hypothetical protein [Acinetobacter higginsii]
MTEKIVSEKSQLLAQALMLEQVSFYKNQLTTQLSVDFFQQFIQLFLQHAPNIQLKEVVELEQIQAVVKRYAFEMQLGAGLLEFIGEIAQRLHVFSLQSSAQLQDVFSDHQFEMWLSKFLELENIRHYLNQFLKESPSIQQLCQYIATTTLQNKLPKLFAQSDEAHISESKYEWQQKLKSFSHRQQQRIEQKIEESIGRFIQEQLVDLSLLSNDDLESLARNIWDDNKTQPLSEYTKQVTPLDVEEFFVMIYEYWKELRQSSFIQDLILYGVKVFYDFYKDESLEDVFAAIGIEETDLLNEAVRFYPKVVVALDEHDVLEPIITLILKPFYESPQTLATIEKHL